VLRVRVGVRVPLGGAISITMASMIYSLPITVARTFFTTTMAMALSRMRRAKAGLGGPSRNWSTGCAFVDYDRDGRLDLFVASYVDFNPATIGLPGSGPNCLFEGCRCILRAARIGRGALKSLPQPGERQVRGRLRSGRNHEGERLLRLGRC